MRAIEQAMATVAEPPRLRSSRYDRIFFAGVATFILAAVFLGFAQTYYLSGLLTLPAWKAGMGPPLRVVVHVHALIFSSWILLLIAQTSLVSAGRVDLHRRFGLFGFGLAGLVVLAGVIVVSSSLAGLPPGDPAVRGSATLVLRAVAFGLLAYFGYRQRHNPPAHKRLMVIATIALLPAPLVRWPVLIAGNFPLAIGCCYALLVFVACYDVWSTRRVHLATVFGSAIVIVSNPPVVGVYTHNATWLVIATQMQKLGHLFR
jgi:hypothetical protein